MFGLRSEVLEERYPELIGLSKRLGNEDFNMVVFFCLWARNHHIEKGDAQRLLSEIAGSHTEEIASQWKPLVSAAEYVSSNKKEEVDSLMEQAEISLKEKLLTLPGSDVIN